MGTEKIVGGIPVRTVLHSPPSICQFGWRSVLVERGAYEPSPAESFVPFYRDPTQRIIALVPPYPFGYPVLRVGALLKFLEDHGGSEIEWDGWKSHVVIASVGDGEKGISDIWVSGCRLFFITPSDSSPGAEMKVFDFSVEGRAKYLSEEMNTDVDGVRCLPPTIARVQIPWNALLEAHNGHDSIVFARVSVKVSHFPRNRD